MVQSFFDVLLKHKFKIRVEPRNPTPVNLFKVKETYVHKKTYT